jgi:hypothetical protein
MKLNRRHPIARHLIGCWFAKGGPALHNLCAPFEAPTYQGTSEPKFDGNSVQLDSNLSYTTGTKVPQLTADSNYFWYIKYTLVVAVASFRVVMGNRFDGGSSPLRFCKLTEGDFDYYNSADDLTLAHPEDAGGTYEIAVVKEGSTFTMYLDGEFHAQDTSSKVMDVENPVILGGGGSTSLGEPTNIRVFHAAHGPIAPTDEQIYSLYKDPEQLLYRPLKTDYYFVSADAGQSGATSDTLNFSDTFSGVAGSLASVPDNITLNDTQAGAAGALASTTDAVNLDDSVSSVAGQLASTLDAIDLADTKAGVAQSVGLVSDGLSIADTLTALSGAIATALEGFSLSDTYTGATTGAATGSTSDTVNLDDTVSGSAGAQSGKADGLSISDSYTAATGTEQTGATTDSVTFNDVNAGLAAAIANKPDGISVDDVYSAIVNAAASVSDQIQLTDTNSYPRESVGPYSFSVDINLTFGGDITITPNFDCDINIE